MHGALHGAERAGLKRSRPRRRTGTALRAQRQHAAHGLAPVERALGTMGHLQAVAARRAHATERDRIVGVGIVEPDAIDQKQGLVRIGAAQEERRHAAGCAGSQRRGAGNAAKGRPEVGELHPRQIGGADGVDEGARGRQRRGGARRREDIGGQLFRLGGLAERGEGRH